MNRFYSYILLAMFVLSGCSDPYECVEYSTEYDFTVSMPVLTDSLEVDGSYIVSYNSHGIWDAVSEKLVYTIPPMFGVSVRVYEIDTSYAYPVHKPAAKAFAIQNEIPNSYLGSSELVINMAINKFDNGHFKGAIKLKPNRKGLFLLELVDAEAYPVYGGSYYKCQQQERMSFRILQTGDPAASYYNQLEQANRFKPGLNRLIWVK